MSKNVKFVREIEISIERDLHKMKDRTLKELIEIETLLDEIDVTDINKFILSFNEILKYTNIAPTTFAG